MPACLCLLEDNGLLFPYRIVEELPTIRELSDKKRVYEGLSEAAESRIGRCIT